MATSTTVKEFNTDVENTLVLAREDGAHLQFALQHFGSHHELDLAVFDMADPEQPVIRDLVTLSLVEVKMLRTLLNKPSVVALLDAAE